MALFSAWEKKFNLQDFLCILHEAEWPLVLQMSTYFIPSRLSDRLIFRNSLSLGLVF